MDIGSLLDFLDDLEAETSEAIGRKLLGNRKYDELQVKKKERYDRELEKISQSIKNSRAKLAEEEKKEMKKDQMFAKKMQREYKKLGIDLQLEGLSFGEMLDEMEKADRIIDKQEEELDRELDELLND